MNKTIGWVLAIAALAALHKSSDRSIDQIDLATGPVMAAPAAAPMTQPAEAESGYTPVADAERQFYELFVSCGTQHGIDPALLAAVAAVESSYRTNAVSEDGAQGLMQFMPATAKAMGVDPWNPESAICGAARYLATSIGLHNNWDEAIAAYNAGDPAVARKGARAADGDYVLKVIGEWQKRGTPPAPLDSSGAV